MRNSETYEQLTIFDLVEDNGFCWDSDINEIYKMIEGVAEKHGFPISRAEWSIWDHVPYLGYRMAVTLEVKRCELSDSLYEELEHIVDFAKERNIDISPIQPYYFDLENDPNEVGAMFIYSMFKDKTRQKKR